MLLRRPWSPGHARAIALAALLAAALVGACSDDSSPGPDGDGGAIDDGGTRTLADGRVVGPEGGSSGGGGTGGSAAGDGGQSMTDGAVIDCQGDECASMCGTDSLWNGTTCAPCPQCNNAGEIGRWPNTTRNGFCICETAPGFFYSVAGSVGAQRCDADGDGWVRESARTVLSEQNDPELTANAHCNLRTIDRFVLRNEAGESREELLDVPLPLYESDRNDDDGLLEFRWQRDNLPNFHNEDKPVGAAEINSLTKICHSINTDYNDNGVPDVKEYPDVELPPDFDIAFKPYVEFSYFTELHRGYYKASTTGGAGSYIIQEKSRKLTGGGSNERVQIKYGPSERDYWRECPLARDSEWDTLLPPIGMDFASFAPTSSWSGMNLHSQFKCFVLSSTPDPENPNQVTRADLDVTPLEYRLSRCRAQGLPTNAADNPSDTSFTCEVVDVGTTSFGDAYWGAFRYVDYQLASKPPDATLAPEYIRGCLNGCDGDTACGTITGPSGDEIDACKYDPSNFGRKTGCAEACDGIDNDLDGIPDNGADGLACTPQDNNVDRVGVCAVGTTRCETGAMFFCDGIEPGTQTELCDGLDSDCDGTADTDPDPDIPGLNSFCDTAVDPALDPSDPDYQLHGICRLGTNQCVEVTTGAEPEVKTLCISDIDAQARAALVESPCNATDDDCDGLVDETYTFWEGDDQLDNGASYCQALESCPQTRAQCTGSISPETQQAVGAVDDNCRDGAASSTSNNDEICENDIDDDCDGRVDESYWPSSSDRQQFRCKWPCYTEGSVMCSNSVVPVPLVPQSDVDNAYAQRDALYDYNAIAPSVAFEFDPPWYNGYWKLLRCTGGKWEIDKVCGLGVLDTANLPGTAGSWVTSGAAVFCNTQVQACTAVEPTGVTWDTSMVKCSYPSGSPPSCTHCYGQNACP